MQDPSLGGGSELPYSIHLRYFLLSLGVIYLDTDWWKDRAFLGRASVTSPETTGRWNVESSTQTVPFLCTSCCDSKEQQGELHRMILVHELHILVTNRVPAGPETLKHRLHTIWFCISRLPTQDTNSQA